MMANELQNVEAITTGTFLDRLTGGLPKGRLVEIWGDEEMGKSTLCLQVVAGLQRQGLRCLWADVEHTFDAMYSARLGVDNSKLEMIIERNAEDVINQVERRADDGSCDLIVIDSIGGMRSRQEAEKESGEKVIAAQAGLMTRASKNLAASCYYSGCTIIGINHSFIDIMSGAVKTSGGKKWQHFKRLAIRLKSAGLWIKQGDEIIGKKVIAEVTKDQWRGNTKKTVSADLISGQGFSATGDILEVALAKGVIKKDGGNFFFQGEKVCFGMPRMRKWLEEHQEEVKNLL